MDTKELFLKAEFSDILGQDEAKEQLKSALVSGRHILILGQPGIGKTTLAKNIAKLLPSVIMEISKSDGKKEKVKVPGEKRFIRVQGSPDLVVEDLLGDIDPIKALKFGPTSVEAFTPGKIFKAQQGILFFDEINRASEKLQNALLQVMQEGEATIGSYTVNFPVDFVLIATMNPEDSSTEKMSSVLLDRFDVIYMGYPEKTETEEQIARIKGKNLAEFPKNLLDLTVKYIRRIREHKNIEKKPSVRATIGIYERAQANALIDKRKKVNLKDISKALVSVLSHRIEFKPSVKYVEDPVKFLTKEFSDFLKEEKSDIP